MFRLLIILTNHPSGHLQGVSKKRLLEDQLLLNYANFERWVDFKGLQFFFTHPVEKDVSSLKIVRHISQKLWMHGVKLFAWGHNRKRECYLSRPPNKSVLQQPKLNTKSTQTFILRTEIFHAFVFL